jgi:TRAP-type C4-dicarboxylate transport system substrate-binding protein
MKRLCVSLLLVTLFIFFAQPIAAAEPATLKASCFFTKDHPLAWGVFSWIDNINNELKGQVKVNYVGGPEVIPTLEQIEAVKKGIIDVSFTSGSHYGPQVPVGYTLTLSRLMPWEERKSGYSDILVKEHEKVGVRYLGRWLHGGFYMWLKEPVKAVDELKARRLRTFTTYERFYKALGIAGVGIQPAETYTALERGVVDGTLWPLVGPREEGWTRFLKYYVNQELWPASNLVILVNMNTWNKFPDDLKAKLHEITASSERKVVAHFQEKNKNEREALEKVGIKQITFSPADAKRFADLSYDVEWAELEKKIPDLIPSLKKAAGY